MRFTLLAVVAAATIIAGCSSDNSVSNGGGNLQVFLTDAPIDLSQVWVTISEIDVHQTGSDWNPISTMQHSQDLLALKNTQMLIASANLANGSYTGFRLFVTAGYTIDSNGNRCNLTIPSDKIEVPVNFDIKNGKMTSVVLDFNAQESVQVTQTGSSEKCILRPVIKPVSVQSAQ